MDFSKKSQTKKYIISLSIVLLIIILLERIGVFYTNSLDTYDMFYQKTSTSNPNIIIVGIDDESLNSLGRWPWKRSVVAKGLDIILSGDPASVGIDIIYTEKDRDEKEDIALSKVVSGRKNVIMSSYYSFNDYTVNKQLSIRSKHLPLSMFDTSVAFINVVPDKDGILRKFLPYINDSEQRINFFSYEIYKRAYEKLGKKTIDIENIPRDDFNRVPIMYSSRPTNFTVDDNNTSYEDAMSDVEHIPFSYILDGFVEPEYFKDKIVLMGATSIGVADDYYFTAIAHETPMFGIQVHANIINQLIRENFLKEVSNNTLNIFMLIFGILTIFASVKLKPKYYVISFIGTFGLLYIVYLIMLKYSYMISPFYMIFTIVIMYISALIGKYFMSLKEKLHIESVFGKYIEKSVLKKLIDGDKKYLSLGGEKIDVTVLFVDIRGFTSLSEVLSPEEVVSILNEYLTLSSNSVFATGGTLDKYIGDATMAFWNAPIPVENHQLCAIKTAILMRDGSYVLNEKLEAMFGRKVYFGIGIHTGPAVIGNIGSQFRMDYTAIGDTVNTTSRIEGQTKANQILISKEVYDIVKDEVECKYHDNVMLKGKQKPIDIYEVIKLK